MGDWSEKDRDERERVTGEEKRKDSLLFPGTTSQDGRDKKKRRGGKACPFIGTLYVASDANNSPSRGECREPTVVGAEPGVALVMAY